MSGGSMSLPLAGRQSSAHWVPGRRELLLVASLGLAFADTIGALIAAMQTGAPEGRLLLVPVMAAGLAWILVRRAPPAVPINDRQVDLIVGIGLLLAAVYVHALGNSGPASWIDRLGAQTLAFVLATAGALAVIYSVRRLWTVRWALAFLMLMWPVAHVPLEAVGSILGQAIGAADPAGIGALVSISAPAIVAVSWASNGSPLGRGITIVIGGMLAAVLTISVAAVGEGVVPLYPTLVGIAIMTITIGVSRTMASPSTTIGPAAGRLRVSIAVLAVAVAVINLVGGSASDPAGAGTDRDPADGGAWFDSAQRRA